MLVDTVVQKIYNSFVKIAQLRELAGKVISFAAFYHSSYNIFWKVEHMNKKKKKKIIRYSIILGVLVVLLVVVLVLNSDKSSLARQFDVENTDEMAFNPFISNEKRLDNSLLEYGKVLSKYREYRENGNANYHNYTGEPISLSGELDAAASSDYKEDENGKLVSIPVRKFSEMSDYDYLSYPVMQYNSGKAFMTDFEEALYVSANTTTLTYHVNVPQSGLYSLQIEYLMLAGKNTNMLAGLTVNGKQPFLESSYLELKRAYEFYDTDLIDVTNNQIRPKQREVYLWQSAVMSHPDGLYRNPYRFYLAAGENTIVLTFSREAGVIGDISLIAPVENPTYDSYLQLNQFSDSNIYNKDAKQIQFEVPDYISNVGLRMEYDDNYCSVPASYDYIHYNVFGGTRWNSGGDTVSWSFDVPKGEAGWYQIGFRYQTSLTYVVSYREIRINGEIPFQEMEEYCFPYSDGWVGSALKDSDQNPYLFYLKEGTNTITITSKVGPLRHSLQKIEEAMDSISELVRKVVQLTSSTRSSSGGYVVDKNRDWDLQRYIPDIQEHVETYAAIFKECYAQIQEANGGYAPYYASAVQVAQKLFESISEDLETMPSSLNEITNAQTGLSNTLVSIKDQPMAIDYMILSGSGYDYSSARSNFWQGLYVGIRRFYWSWVKDYSMIGVRDDALNAEKEITVYVSRGREHVDIMRNLISEQFTPNTGIKVNVNMVAGSSEGLIMQRYVAGTAPDVAISIGVGTPFEFAIRGALLPLNDLDRDGVDDNPEFYELAKSEYYWRDGQGGAFEPFKYRGDYYGFPETQNWVALFYRTDIMEELDLDVPNTWDDVYSILPVLQEAGYDFCHNYGVGGYTPFLYQYGGDLYDIDGMTSALNTNAAYLAFREYADLYLKYNVVYQANFYMRFKSGEMPIGIGDMALYCQLNYSAPELAGKWAMAPVPGHYLDGELVRDYSGVATSSIIISSTKYPQESWEFLKWWHSADVQAEYGREVEATFGVASRWNPANRLAVEQLPYTAEELSVILAQWDYLRESPNVMGGYYTSRYLLTALNQTVLQGANARFSLEDAIKEINKEMERKQEEFGITDTVLRDPSALAG